MSTEEERKMIGREWNTKMLEDIEKERLEQLKKKKIEREEGKISDFDFVSLYPFISIRQLEK